MDTIRDFADMLELLGKHKVRYLVIGGLAVIYHARPRYTKDIDIWVDPSAENVTRVNAALSDFGSPVLLDAGSDEQIVQIGVEPNRIDLIRTIDGMDFDDAWEKREEAPYGTVPVNWIDIDSLILMKSRIEVPRHQDDAMVLQVVNKLRQSSKQKEKEVNRE